MNTCVVDNKDDVKRNINANKKSSKEERVDSEHPESLSLSVSIPRSDLPAQLSGFLPFGSRQFVNVCLVMQQLLLLFRSAFSCFQIFLSKIPLHLCKFLG